MTERAIAALGVWAVLGMNLACSSQLAPDERDSGADAAAAVDGGPRDPAACGCRLDSTYTLEMSMACLCSRYGCTGRPPPVCGRSAVAWSWTVACGLSVFGAGTFGADVWVYDGAKLVGVQFSSDTSEFFCPSDPSLKSFAVKAGQFPDSSCPVRTCACDAGAGCALPDAGAD